MNSQRTERKLPELSQKEKRLAHILEEMNGCVIAFSGGLDSSFLAYMAKKHVHGRVLCVTIQDPSTPRMDMDSARGLASKIGLEHLVISSDLSREVIANNPERCYFCKASLFQRLREIAEEEGLFVLDGENASDASDTRPGRRAAAENNIISPLALAGLTKEEIHALAEEEGLPEPHRPPSACLSSRIPYGTAIEERVLDRVDSTEDILRSMGFKLVRARVEGSGLRIEIGEGVTYEAFSQLKEVEPEIKKMGWKWVALDLGGYVPAGQRDKI